MGQGQGLGVLVTLGCPARENLNDPLNQAVPPQQGLFVPGRRDAGHG